MFTYRHITNGNKTLKITHQLIPSGAHLTLSQCIGKLETDYNSSPGPMAPLWMSSGVTRTTTSTCTTICVQALTPAHQAHQAHPQIAIHQNNHVHLMNLPTLGRLLVQAHHTTATAAPAQKAATTLTANTSKTKFMQHLRLLTRPNGT